MLSGALCKAFLERVRHNREDKLLAIWQFRLLQLVLSPLKHLPVEVEPRVRLFPVLLQNDLVDFRRQLLPSIYPHEVAQRRLSYVIVHHQRHNSIELFLVSHLLIVLLRRCLFATLWCNPRLRELNRFVCLLGLDELY